MTILPPYDLPSFDMDPHLRHMRIAPETIALCREHLVPSDAAVNAAQPHVFKLAPGYCQSVLHRMRQTHASPVIRAEKIKLEAGLCATTLRRKAARHIVQEARRLKAMCEQEGTASSITRTITAPEAEQLLLDQITAVRDYVDFILHLLKVFGCEASFQHAYESWEITYIVHTRQMTAAHGSVPELIDTTHAFNAELAKWAGAVLDLFGQAD